MVMISHLYSGLLGILIAAGLWLGGRQLPSQAQIRHSGARHSGITSACCPSIHFRLNWW